MASRKGKGCNQMPNNKFSMPNARNNISSSIPRSMMNVGKYRNSTCNTVCINNSMFIGYKNSINNIYLAKIPIATKINDTFKLGSVRGTKKIIKYMCVDRQYGTRCGKGGLGPENKF